MNKYLVKIAEMSEENKAVASTAAKTLAVDAVASVAGGYLGHKIGKKFGRPSLGTFIGSHGAGGLATVAALKGSLHGRIKDNERND